MLVISRKSGEYLVLNDEIFIKVLKVKDGGEEGDKVKLAIEAPEDVRVSRGEIWAGRGELQQRMDAVRSERLGRRAQKDPISDAPAEESAS